MSLPREWSLQDSRGSVHRSSGPAGMFPIPSSSSTNTNNSTTTAATAAIGTQQTTKPTTNVTCASDSLPILASKMSTGTVVSIGIGSSTFAEPMRFDENECPISAGAFAVDCCGVAGVGSLSSVHSAPPVPLADLSNGICLLSGGTSSPNNNGSSGYITGKLLGAIGNGGAGGVGGCNITGGSSGGILIGGSTGPLTTAVSTSSALPGRRLVDFELGPPDSPTAASSAARCRPISLALDAGSTFHSTKTIAAMQTSSCHQQHQQQQHHHHHAGTASEADEEDNENLLTVSSLTARPLIAKSHELRTTKLAERFRQRNRRMGPAEPLDGGYGWFIVLGAFFVQFWVAGLVKSYGVLFVEILETFPNSSTAVASWIPAILSALCLALAPLSSALCQRFSCRSVVFVGGLFCTFGLTLSYFATSMYHLLFTFGILTGIGGGLSTTPGIIIVSLYFDKHRALANGICVSGTAAGSFVFPMLIEHLVHNFGFHGTILILGGCMLHVCASAALYRPIDINGGGSESNASNSVQNRTPEPVLRAVVSSAAGLDTSTTYVGSVDDDATAAAAALGNKKYIEHLFLEESKNRMNDFYNKNKFVRVSEKSLANGNVDSDDEVKDIVGETRFMKPIKSIRSSSLLHSVEDLSTDSTCVYKARSGFDSNRSSRRRAAVTKPTMAVAAAAPFASTDTMLGTVSGGVVAASAGTASGVPPPPTSTIQSSASRGLSKSMIIPTPISDFSEYDDDGLEADEKKPKTCCDRIRKYLDISLLSDPKFKAMCLSVMMMSTGCPYMLYFLPAYAISAGYTKSEAGLLVAVSAALDLIGRLGFGYLCDLQLFDRKKAYIVCILGAGSAVLVIPTARSLYMLGSAMATYGLCLGSWYLLMPVLLADLFGTERISSSYGLVRMFQSVGAISVPPLAGYMRDLTGGYEICFYCMGTCMVLGSVPLLVSAMLYGDDEDGDEADAESETDDATAKGMTALSGTGGMMMMMNEDCEVASTVS